MGLRVSGPQLYIATSLCSDATTKSLNYIETSGLKSINDAYCACNFQIIGLGTIFVYSV